MAPSAYSQSKPDSLQQDSLDRKHKMCGGIRVKEISNFLIKMKKNLVLFLASVIFFTIGYSCCHFTRQGTDISNKYIYIGNCIDSLISSNYRSNFNRIEYEDGVDPYGVYNKKNGIVENANMAYTIANTILSNIYGSNQIKNEYPLKITLINNRFWVIEGSLSKGETGGTAIIVIKKDDGQVQYINHGK